MVEITKNTRQIIFEGDEIRKFAREIEAAFVSLDTQSGMNTFSLNRMKELFPQMANLYHILLSR